MEMSHLKHQAQGLVLSRTLPTHTHTQSLKVLVLGAPYSGLNVKASVLQLSLPIPRLPRHPSGALPGLSSAQAPSCQQALAPGKGVKRAKSTSSCPVTACKGGGVQGALATRLQRWEPQVPHLLMGSQQGVQPGARINRDNACG